MFKANRIDSAGSNPTAAILRGIAATALMVAVGVATPAVSGRAEQRFPDVIAAKAAARGVDRFDFDVTISSPYDSAARYADAFRVAGRDGTIYGERKLLHDHASEQPFTRDLYGVTIPPAVKSVTVQARDMKYGYGGKTVEVRLPGR